MNKDLKYYLALPYPIELIEEEGEGVVARVPLLPGCITQGDTATEALELIADAKEAWLEVSLENGDDIPEPCSEYSGKFLLRLPRSLHRRLAELASYEGISLNQYCVGRLQEQSSMHQK